MSAVIDSAADASATAKQKVLIDRLLVRTRAGELDWQSGIDGRTFTLAVPPGLVFVSQKPFDEGDHCGVQYQLDVCDGDGRPVGSLREDFYVGERETGSLVELYSSARESARGASRLIDQMLSTLAA